MIKGYRCCATRYLPTGKLMNIRPFLVLALLCAWANAQFYWAYDIPGTPGEKPLVMDRLFLHGRSKEKTGTPVYFPRGWYQGYMRSGFCSMDRNTQNALRYSASSANGGPDKCVLSSRCLRTHTRRGIFRRGLHCISQLGRGVPDDHRFRCVRCLRQRRLGRRSHSFGTTMAAMLVS